MADTSDAHKASARSTDAHPLDAMTGGAFSASTSGERAGRVRDWLATQPSLDQVQNVFKEMSGRDKGAAKLLREKLDEQKRAKGQETLAADWADKARTLLASPKLNIADALAWQRDAAKAGAPLSREPLAAFKAELAERVRIIEDLQHRVQVQREAAVLLAQRTEVLSTKPWRDAEAAVEPLRGDVGHWQSQADEIAADARWPSVDARFPPLLDGARSQLLVVWEAFQSALALAVAAAADPAAPLPTVPVWAEQIAHSRGGSASHGAAPGVGAAGAGAGQGGRPAAGGAGARAPRPKADPAVLEAARAAVTEAVAKLELETSEGHGKASVGAAADLRAVLKEHGRHIDTGLEVKVNTALQAAGELEGWQRWGADRAREDLVARAEGLLQRPDGQGLGGRKMQDILRQLREQWKRTDQGGAPNHGLWRRFDAACNEAHKVVEAWLERIKTEAAEHRAQRLALIEELKAWTASIMGSHDLKAIHRSLHQFADRWRDAGHLGEKAASELQPLWQEAFAAAAGPMEAEQQQSIERRHALIEEAVALGAASDLRIDAVRSLQQRWQAEAQGVPMDRRQEQKLWDAFRKPIDEAFQRKTADREKVAANTSEHDRLVLQASKAVEAAVKAGDAQTIRMTLSALEAATRGQALAAAQLAAIDALTGTLKDSSSKQPPAQDGSAQAAMPVIAGDASAAADGATAEAEPEAKMGSDATPATSDAVPADNAAQVASVVTEGNAAPTAEDADVPADAAADAVDVPVAAPPPPPPKKVVAVRGDDRPGARNKAEQGGGGRGGPGGRPGGPGGRPGGSGGPGGDRGAPRGGDRFGGAGGSAGAGRFGDREPREERGPRLGDAAFRAQREALEHAQASLRMLAAQAHGEALTQLLEAWEKRDPAAVPGTQDLGGRVAPAVRGAWTQALGKSPAGDAGKAAAEALLRLEMAADAPTPAEHISARRMLQLQLLTRRNDPAPAQTWGEDAAKVLAAPHEPQAARRLQNTLKTLLRG